MAESWMIKRTTSTDGDFQALISRLDDELWNELNEDQSTYNQYNKVQDLHTVVVVYANKTAVGCGCFKEYDAETVEIKRMFVEKPQRGRGFSKLILEELERWAKESGFRSAILETSIHFKAARSLYTRAGYSVIDNYDQYAGLEESVCMKKKLLK